MTVAFKKPSRHCFVYQPGVHLSREQVKRMLCNYEKPPSRKTGHMRARACVCVCVCVCGGGGAKNLTLKTRGLSTQLVETQI
jgi:hypothetical protein